MYFTFLNGISNKWNDLHTLVVRIVELENSAQINGGNKLLAIASVS